MVLSDNPIPGCSREAAVTQTTQPNLFDDPAAAETPTTGLFADVVFDRPLDQAYSYAVPEALRDRVAVGKRVQVPFGRGDKTTVGYCVGLTETAPPREVKSLVRVLDDEALFNPHLLRLTRWMADYYLCGWGQVLNAVIPAGAKDQAGTRTQIFLEAIPVAELPAEPPKLTAKQSAALDILRQQRQPIEARRLA